MPVLVDKNKLSSTESFAWKFIQDNLEIIPTLSIVELGEKANVSTATIVRTLRKKGYQGYSDFKHDTTEVQAKSDFTNPTVQIVILGAPF